MKTSVSESLFHKVAGVRPATLSQKKLWHRCLPVDFGKFLRTTLFSRTPSVAVSENHSVDFLKSPIKKQIK